MHYIPIQAEANTSQRKVGDKKIIFSVELHQNQGRQPSLASVMLMVKRTKAEQLKALSNAAYELLHNLLQSSTVIACFTHATVESE